MTEPIYAILAAQQAVHAWQTYALSPHWDGEELHRLSFAMDTLRIKLGLPDVIYNEMRRDDIN